MIHEYTDIEDKKLQELRELVYASEFADIGFVDSMGIPGIRRVFCT